MSLELELRELSAAIRVPARFPDRVVVKDPELAEYLGELLNFDPADEQMTEPWIALNQFWRLRDALRSWKWSEEFPAPEGINAAMDEAEWAYKSVWSGDRVAWMFGPKRAVIQSPYTLTLSEAIDRLSSPYHYSTLLKGWVVSHAVKDADDLECILSEYEITPSVMLADALQGRGGWQQLLQETVAAAREEGFQVPKGFDSGRVLRPHQEEGVLALAKQGSTLLGDQVGLGKGGEFTCGLLSLNDFLSRAHEDAAFPAVFSVTKSMKDEIVEEILKWKGDARIELLAGTRSAEIDPSTQFIVLNHDILASRLPDILEITPRAFVADEAHVFKNEGAKRSAAALELAEAIRENNPDHPYIVLATGTPFLNGPIELWSMLGILGQQEEFGKYALNKIGSETVRVRTPNGWKIRKIWPKRAFEIRWCNGHYDKFGAWHNEGQSHTAELNRLLVEAGMVRRRKSDIMHPLPPLEETVEFLEPSEDEMAEYRRVDDEFRQWLIEETRREAEEEDLDVQDALRVVLSKLDSGGEGMMRLTALRKQLAFAKVDSTVEWIHRFMAGDPDITGGDPQRRKLIVFVHHKEPRQRLVNHPELQQYGVVTILAGDEQNGESIQEDKRRFQTEDEMRLIICTMAAREGHTLTAARDVLLMEIPFVPSWIVQMAGRCWARISELYEPHEAYVHYAVVEGTEDARSIRRVRIKKATFNAVIDGEGQDDTISDLQEESLETLLEALAIGVKELTVAR